MRLFSMPRVRLFVLSCFGLLAVLQASHAQSPQPPEPPPAAAITFMSWEQPVRGLFTTLDGKKFSEIHCPAYQFGRASQIKPVNTLQLYRQVEQDGKQSYEPTVSVPLPPDSLELQAYIVRQPDKDGVPAYRVIVMPNDIATFPAGDVRVFNFTPYPAMVRFGEESHPLQSLEWKQMRAKPDRKYRVILMTALQVGGAWIEGGRELMSLRPEYRGDVLVVHTKADIGTAQAQNNARALTITETQYVVEARRPERSR